MGGSQWSERKCGKECKRESRGDGQGRRKFPGGKGDTRGVNKDVAKAQEARAYTVSIVRIHAE